MYIVHSMFPVHVQKVDEVIEIYKNRSRLTMSTISVTWKQAIA